MFWGKFRAVPKRSQMHPNGKKRTKTWVSVPMVWIGSVSCEKFEKDIMARTFSLIALVWCVLQHVSCSSKTVPNAPKRKETHQNMSLGSNGVDRECSLQKIMTRLHGTNFYINCTTLARFARRFVQYRNGPKCTQTERNTPKQEIRVQWYGSGVFFVKNSNKTTRHELLH